MVRPASKTKLPRQSGGEIKRVANAREPPVVVPVVVVAVDVELALVVPPVERDDLCEAPSVPLPFKYF